MLYEGLVGMRHPDHRFEWTRAEFGAWAARVGETYGYTSSTAASATWTPSAARRPRWPSFRRVRAVTERTITVPAMGLVVLVGVSGSGKSTFASAHFKPTEVVSSDFCRGLVADDENDQSATPDAFDVLHYIVGTRLRRGLLTVVDATSVQPAARASLVKLAKSHDVLVDAIVLDVPESVAVDRNAQRPDRDFGKHVVTRQSRDLQLSMRASARRASGASTSCGGATRSRPSRSRRENSWNDRREVHGPFDIIGDVHGCASELRTLLAELGWQIHYDGDAAVDASHPDGRQAVFVGDLVDRGPDTPGVLRLVMGMVESGNAMCVSGNHEAKLVRALKGANVTVSHGLAESLAQLARRARGVPRRALAFMDGLISHFVLDDGRLVVAHAGLKEAYHGRSSGRVRSFALYGDTTGETDDYGLPVRYPWAQDYRGQATVVYGHTPVPTAEWINNTICLDTGVVFGGTLTALRYPEREIVSVPAEQEWYEPVRPLAPAAADRQPPCSGSTTSPGPGGSRRPRRQGQDPRGELRRGAGDHEPLRRRPALADLPPAHHVAARPRRSRRVPGAPGAGLRRVRRMGVTAVVCEEKHMGSRAIAVIARDEAAAERRFGIGDGSTGVVYTRTGRPFFADTERRSSTGSAAARRRAAVRGAGHRLARPRLRAAALVGQGAGADQGAVRLGGRRRPPRAARGAHRAGQAAARGLDVGDLATRTQRRLDNAAAFRDAYAAYCRPDGRT